jgi:hypothetical protein
MLAFAVLRLPSIINTCVPSIIFLQNIVYVYGREMFLTGSFIYLLLLFAREETKNGNSGRSSLCLMQIYGSIAFASVASLLPYFLLFREKNIRTAERDGSCVRYSSSLRTLASA